MTAGEAETLAWNSGKSAKTSRMASKSFARVFTVETMAMLMLRGILFLCLIDYQVKPSFAMLAKNFSPNGVVTILDPTKLTRGEAIRSPPFFSVHCSKR